MSGRTAPTRLSTRLTGPGRVVVGLSGLVALAAANTAANLLYLILALLLSLLAVSLRGRRRLGGARVELSLPSLAEAGRTLTGSLRVVDRGGRPFTARMEAARFLPPRGLLVAAGPRPVPLAFAAAAPARGIYRTIEARLIDGGPFHLIAHERALELPTGVAVHPALLPPGRQPAAPSAGEAHDRPRAGQGGGLRNLRPYAAGDNPRHLHWRSSARTGVLTVREFHDPSSPRVVVELPRAVAPGESLEAALSQAASIVRDALDSGAMAELVEGGWRETYRGPADLARALRRLAAFPRVSAGAGS